MKHTAGDLRGEVQQRLQLLRCAADGPVSIHCTIEKVICTTLSVPIGAKEGNYTRFSANRKVRLGQGVMRIVRVCRGRRAIGAEVGRGSTIVVGKSVEKGRE